MIENLSLNEIEMVKSNSCERQVVAVLSIASMLTVLNDTRFIVENHVHSVWYLSIYSNIMDIIIE